MKRKLLSVIIALALLVLTGCSGATKPPEDISISDVRGIRELATMDVYFHNVARFSEEASGFFSFLGTGYKKVWFEYDGIVTFGIDFDQVKLDGPDENGTIIVSHPPAKILHIQVDENSISTPIEEAGIFTDITTEEKTKILGNAQDYMLETANSNATLFREAEEKAEQIIEHFILNTGKALGKTYTIEFVRVEGTASPDDNSSTGENAPEQSASGESKPD